MVVVVVGNIEGKTLFWFPGLILPGTNSLDKLQLLEELPFFYTMKIS